MNARTHNTLFPIHTLAVTTALVVAGLTFAAGPSLAGEVEVVSQTVNYSDLNLARSEGAATLYGRIRSAARHVCTSNDSPELRFATAARTCIKQAIAHAVADVNQPQLTQYYLVKTGQVAPVLAVASTSR
ncbi:MAG TPA: UrcA family protein [Steroidobacteraceae bacterium]|nr:UrcA family protein [Steroidobacteraceae bacterium]